VVSRPNNLNRRSGDLPPLGLTEVYHYEYFMISEIEFEKIYLDNYGLVWNFCRKRTFNFNDFDIDDIVQNTFVKVFQKYDLYDSSKSSIRTWICAIAKNEVVDYVKIRNKQPKLFDMSIDESGDDATAWGFKNKIEERLQKIKGYLGEEQNVFERRFETVRSAVNKLPSAQRLIIDRHYQDGVSYANIAKEVGERASMVRKRAQRGIDKIKKLVGV